MVYPIFETTKTTAQEFTLLSRGLSKGLDYLRNTQVGKVFESRNIFEVHMTENPRDRAQRVRGALSEWNFSSVYKNVCFLPLAHNSIGWCSERCDVSPNFYS